MESPAGAPDDWGVGNVLLEESGSATAGLSSSVHKCGDRVVAAGGIAQGAASGVGGACVQGSSLAHSTKNRFTGPGAAQAQANRVYVFLGLQHRPAMWVDEAPHPGVVDLRVAELQKPRVGASGTLVLVHLEQPLMDARVHAGGDEGLDLLALACHGVIPQACLRDGVASVPKRTLRQRRSRSAKASSS